MFKIPCPIVRLAEHWLRTFRSLLVLQLGGRKASYAQISQVRETFCVWQESNLVTFERSDTKWIHSLKKPAAGMVTK